jgi:carbon monoxide dehydrogenase subunit G
MPLALFCPVRSIYYRVGTIIAALLWMLGSALAYGLSATPAAAAQSEIDVKVQFVGEEIRTVASFFVRAPRQHVWDVLTDYDRASEYIRDLQTSKIISRAGDTLRVRQKAEFHFGPFTFPMDTVREVRLVEPSRTESQLVSGSMKKYDATTELVREGDGTRILYRSQAIPGSALSAFVGEATIRRETEEHFKQLRDEVLRRQDVAAK